MLKSFKQSFRDTREATRLRIRAYLEARTHRSFQLTRRRDYVRSLDIPGYWSFSNEVRRTVWSHKKIFIGLSIVYAVLSAVLVGLGSQESYDALTATIRDTGSNIFQGDWGEIGAAGLLFASVATSGLTGTLTEAQQIYAAFLFILVWLTTVWLLRQLMAGRQVRLRDGLYNAGSPIIPSFLLMLLLVVQLIPLAVAAIGYSAAEASGLLIGGIEAMLFWAVAGLLSILSLYWISGTFFAMIIVTLPGTYPVSALRTANQIVMGRRIRLLLRIIWMLVGIIAAWAIVLIPVIILDGWIKGMWEAIAWMPIVPVTLLIMSTITTLWSAAYVYILYRKVVEHDAAE